MGICTSCCEDPPERTPHRSGGDGRSQPYQTAQPDPDTRRQLQAEAAERRAKESEGRGLKDPEKFKRQQKKQDELDRAPPLQQESGGLKWTMS